MLTLTRRPTESVVIDHCLIIMVLSVKGGILTYTLTDTSFPEEATMTRKVGVQEEHALAPFISMIVKRIKGNQALIGFVAPDHISIHRNEIEERIISEGENRV